MRDDHTEATSQAAASLIYMGLALKAATAAMTPEERDGLTLEQMDEIRAGVIRRLGSDQILYLAYSSYSRLRSETGFQYPHGAIRLLQTLPMIGRALGSSLIHPRAAELIDYAIELCGHRDTGAGAAVDREIRARLAEISEDIRQGRMPRGATLPSTEAVERFNVAMAAVLKETPDQEPPPGESTPKLSVFT